MRVRKNQIYSFQPVPMDIISPATTVALIKGEQLRVIQLPGAPPPNTMGQAHVERVSDGKFVGMVSTNSLVA